MDSANKCRKFEANIFNKTKCQNCFKGKEDHSAEALECNRNCRKITGCGYLFVAPDSFNFSNNIDRTKRWQRRFFVLYDDGEFIYSVDENIHTVPQGIIDMNQCSDVFNAQEFTGHQYSIGIKTQDKTTYIKGTSKDEISRWQDLLVVYSKNFKCQPQFRRNPGCAKSNKNQLQTEIDLNSLPADDLSTSAAKNRINEALDKAQGSLSNIASGNATVLNASVDVPTGSRTTSYILTGSMQKQGSTQKLPADPSGANSKGVTEKAPQTYRGVRNMKHKNDKTYVDHLRKSNSLQNLSSANAGSGESHPDLLGRSSSSERLSKQQRTRFGENTMSKSSPDTVIKSSEIPTNQTCLDHTSNDLMFVKKGWLMKQAVDKTWKKCWCVLTSRALTYYNDSKQTDSLENVEGVMILTGDTIVEELPLLRNYSFRISNKTNEYVLSATTFGMRSSWIQDIVKCITSFADSNSHLQPSSLDSTNTAISWRSFATSDSDAEYDTKSRTSSSSWHAFHPVAATVKASPLLTTTSADRSDAASERPYRYLSTSTTAAGHGFAEDTSSGNLQNAPDLLNRRMAGNQARRDYDQTNSGIHNHSTDVGLLKHVDSVDNDTKYSDDRHRSSYDSERHAKKDEGRLSVRKDTSSSLQFRAPSTRIMERTRTKSPKHARSPPPSSTVDHSLDGAVEGGRLSMETRIKPSTLHGAGDSSLLDLMKFEIAALRQQLDATRSQLEDSQLAIANLRKKLVNSSEECQNLTDNLEADKKDHLVQLNRLQQKLSDSTLLAETQNQEILELRNKNQQLVERERNKLDLEYLEKESLRRELLDKSSFISKLESDLKAFRVSVREKEGVLAALDRNWEEKIENAKARWKVEKKALEDQLKETENKLKLLLRQSETAGIESRNVTNVLRDKEGMLSQLQEQLVESEKKLQCTLKELELEMEDNTRIHKELDDYCKENASLKIKLAAEVEKASELDADVRHLREEKQGLVSLTSEKETKNALLLQDVERVESQVRTLVEENGKLKTDLSQSREDTEMIQKKFDSKAAEVEKLKSDLKLQVNECRSLTKSVEGAEAEKTVTKDKIAELEERLSAFRNVSNPQLASDELQKLAFEKEALQEKVISLNQALKKLTVENEAEMKTREEARVEKEKSTLQLKCEYGELIEQHKTMKRGLQQLQTKYDSLTKLNTDLNKQLKENCEERKQIESKMKSLERQVESQKAIIDRQKSAKCDTDNVGEGSTEVVEKDLKEKCLSLAKQLKQLQMEKQQMESQCDDFELANKTLKQEQRSAEVSHTDELDRLNSKVSEMTAKLSQLERRNRRLEQQLRSDDDLGQLDDVSCDAELRNKDGDVALQGPNDASAADNKLLEDLKSENELLLMNNQKLLNQLHEMEENIQHDDTDEIDNGGKNYKENDRILQVAEKERVLDCMIEELEEMKAELERKESSHIQEIQALKDGYEIRIRSLEHDLSVGRLDLAESVEEQNQDLHLYEQKLSQMKVELQTMQSKNNLEKTNFLEEVNDHKDRVRRLESELRMVYQELEKVKATDDEGNVAGESMNDLREEVKQLRVLLREERARHMTEIVKLRNDPSMDPAEASEVGAILRVKELEEQIQNMKDDYEHELQMQKASHRRELISSKDDVMQLLAAAEANSIPIDEESIRRKYMKEVEQIKTIYDKGVSNMEKSHQRTMMELRRNHKIELDRLRQEKDQLLKEEAMATQAALDAMRKAHENDLQKERNKFLDLIAKTFSHADMETLQRQHEEDLELLHYEMKQLTEKFSIKCLENAALTERFVAITKSLHENRKRVQDLLSRNDELNSQLKNKVERLNRAVGFPLTKVDLDAGLEKQDLNSVEVKLQVNQMEILQLREQLENARLDLAVKTEELKECTDKYHEVSTELRHLRKRPSTDQSSHFVSDADSSILFLGRSSSATLRRECSDDEEKNVLTENIVTGSSPPEKIGDHEIGQFDLGLTGQLEMEAEVNASRRSLWRFKNPQRARSNPAVPHSTALKKALSTEADILSLRSSTSSVSNSSVLDNSEAAEASQEELIPVSDC